MKTTSIRIKVGYPLLNKGFTLIELLAVIVILAIIALIATPIILNIIGDTKTSSVIRSGELYLSAVEQAVAKENLSEKFDPKLCIIQSDGNLKCSDSIIEIETNGSRPKSGMIIFENGKISEVENISLDGYILEMDKNQKLVNLGRIEDISPKGTYLMTSSSVSSADTTFLGGTINRSQVEIITIKATKEVPSNAIASWDVSAKKDKSVMAWYTDVDNNNLYELYIGGEGGVKANPNSAYLFEYFSNVVSIDVTYLDTSLVTNMGGIFYNCSDLTILDLSNFNTSKVTNMSYMFAGCSNLLELDLNSFNTNKVINMNRMFFYCIKLSELDVSSFNTNKVMEMSSMFHQCQNLKHIDLSNFETDSLKHMTDMFTGCSRLQILDFRKATFTNVTSYGGYGGSMLGQSVPYNIKVLVRDEEAKTFITNRLLEANKVGYTVEIVS